MKNRRRKTILPKRKRTSDDVFQIFRSMKTQFPITQFAMATKCVTDIQRFEFIEAVINNKFMKDEDKKIDFSSFKTVNAIIWNRFEQGVVRDLKKNMDVVGRGGLLAANLRKMTGDDESDEEMEQTKTDAI